MPQDPRDRRELAKHARVQLLGPSRDIFTPNAGIAGCARATSGLASVAAMTSVRSSCRLICSPTSSAILSFVIRLNGRTILVDTCVGEAKERPELAAFHQRRAPDFLRRLARVEVKAEDDTVFCTHLHVDHVGWNSPMSG